MVAIFTGAGTGFERGSWSLLGSQGLWGASAQGRSGEGVFLNAANGNLLISRQDEFLAGLGGDVAIARTYNSLGNTGPQTADDNSDQWRQSTDRRLVVTGIANTTGSTVTRVSGDGTEIVYTWNGALYTTNEGAGAHDSITFVAGVWTWKDGATQFQEVYEASAVTAGSWRLKSFRDTDANTTSFAYVAASDKLSQIATANNGVSGQVSTITYTWAGNNLSSVSVGYTDYTLETPANKTLSRTSYSYDASNRLISVTVDETPENIADNATAPETLYTTTYTYHGTSKRVASITQSDGSSLTIDYDASGRVEWLVQTAATGDTRVTKVEYFANQTDVKVYQKQFNPFVDAPATWPNFLKTSFNYDANGRLTRLTAPPAYTGATPQEVNFAYDASGNVASVTQGVVNVGPKTLYQYDANGNVTKITDANGNVTDRAYNTTNALILETRTAANAGLTSLLYTRYAYGGVNKLRYAISAEGRVTEYRYNSSGLVERIIEYPQHSYPIGATPPSDSALDTWRDALSDRSTVKVTKFIYDPRGNLAQKITDGAASTTGVENNSEGERQDRFVYDQAGRLLSRYTQTQQTETFVYDGLDRLVGSTDLTGGATTIVFADAATTTTMTTASGFSSVSTYNKTGDLLTRVDSGTDTYTANSTTPGAATIQHQYDKNGRVRVTTLAGAKDASLRYEKTYFLYDKAGKKIAEVGASGQLIEYRYDEATGRLIATTRYTNVLNAAQLTKLADTNSELEFRPSTNSAEAANELRRPSPHSYDIWQWTVYDSGGRVIRTVMGDGSVFKYDYDQSDRLISTTGYYNKIPVSSFMGEPPPSPPSATTPLPTSDGRDRITRTFYDGDGRVIGTLDGEGYLSEIVYDSAGQKVQEIAYAAATLVANRASGTFTTLKGIANPVNDIITRFVYDGQGLLRYTIDALNRITETVYWEGAGSEAYATGLVRKTIAYAAALGTVADYKYATIKNALVAMVQNANLLQDSSGELVGPGSLSTGGYWGKTASSTVIVRSPTGQQSYFDIGLGSTSGMFYSSLRPVSEGQTYTVSGQSSGSGTNGAIPLRVRLDYKDASGAYLSSSPNLNLTRNGTWSNFKLTAVTPVGAVFANVVFDWQGGTGPALIRDVKLEVGSNATRTYNPNLLRDSSGELNGAGSAFAGGYWATDNSAAVTVTVPSGQQSYFDLTLGAAAGNFYSAAAVPATAGQTFTVSGQSNGSGADGSVPLRVRLYYYNSSGVFLSSSTAASLTRNGAWSGFKLTATAPANTASVRVVFDWQGGGGPASIRDVKLETGAIETRWSLQAAALSDRTAHNIYNDRAQLVYSVDAAGAVTGFVYDNLGRVTKTTQFANTTIMSAMGVANAQWKAKLDTWATTNSAGARITRNYYAARGGDLLYSIDAEGYVTGFVYEAQGRTYGKVRYANKLTPTDAWTTATVAAASKGATVWTLYRYDTLGRLQDVYDGTGVVRSAWYYANGLKAWEVVANGQGMDEARTLFVYDQSGKLINERRSTSEITSTQVLGQTATQINGGQRIRSASTLYSAMLTREGELRIYHKGEQVWTNGVRDTTANASFRLVAQADGKLVLYRDVSGQAAAIIWQQTASPAYSGPAFLVMQDDGNLVFAKGTAPASTGTIWSSGTTGFVAQAVNAAEYRDTTYAYDGLGNRLSTTNENGDVTTYEYDKVGRLIKLTNPLHGQVINSQTVNGQTLYEYDAFGRGVKVTDARGNASFNFYDKLGRVIQSVDSEGYITETSYTAFGEIASSTRRANKASNSVSATTPATYAADNARDRVTSFAYDKLGRIISKSDLLVVSPNTQLTTNYSYDSFGNLVKTVDASAGAAWFYYDLLGRSTLSVDAENYVTQTTLDAHGNALTQKRYYNRLAAAPTSTTTPPAMPAAHALDQTTTYTYDGVGRVLTKVDALGGLTQFQYDRRGNLVKTIDALNAASYFYYDKLDRVVLAIDAEGYATATTYKPSGEVASRTRYANKATNIGDVGKAPTLAPDAAKDQTTAYAYDKLGRVITETDALGNATQYQYDAVGNVTQKSEAGLRITNYEYDKLNRLTKTLLPEIYAVTSATGAVATTLSRPTEDFVYDANGNVIQKSDAAGAKTLFWYDKLGRLTHEVSPTATLSVHSYDSNANRIQTIVYATALASPPANATGSAPTQTGATRISAFEYDKLGRLTKTKILNATIAKYDASLATPALTVNTGVTIETQNQYDALGNVVLVTDAKGAKTYAYYDKLGRKLAQIDAANYRTDWSYDANGNVLSERRYANLAATTPTLTAPENANLLLGGDLSLGTSVVAVDWSTAGGPYASAIETVDGVAALTLRKTGAEIFNWSLPTYAWAGTTAVRTGDSATGAFAVSAGERVGFALEAKQLAAGTLQVFAQMVFFNDQGVAISFEPFTLVEADNWERISASIIAPAGAAFVQVRYGSIRTDGVTNAAMDFAIRKLQFHRLESAAATVPVWTPPTASANDRVTTFTYDKMGRRLTERRSGVLSHNGAGAHVSQNAAIAYSYNALGLVASKTEASGDAIVYSYDAGGRMVSEERAGFTDFAGAANVKPRIEYTYNALNDLTQTKAVGNSNAVERVTLYSYGAGGRLETMTDPEGFVRTYRYDAAGRVRREEYSRVKADATSVSEASGTDYDAEGRVIAQGVMSWTGSAWSSAGLDTANMHYNAFGEISERGINGVYAEKFEYDSAGRLTRSNAGDGVWKYFMYDGAGNQTLMITTVGADFDLTTLDTLSEVLALWANPAAIGTTNVAGVVATITLYDARNQAIEVREPQRQRNGTTSDDLITTRAYNAFGEAAYEINALGARVDYTYNTMGRLIKVESPAVSVTGENGVVTANVRPTEHRYYDASGRLVASRDANGNLTKMTLLAGTGYGGSQALVAQTIAADGSVTTTGYDIHGSARKITDQMGRIDLQDLDRAGRLVQVTHAGGLVDNYAYDGLGQRIKHWNSLLGASAAERLTYDAQGRLIKSIAMGGDPIAGQNAATGGDITTYAYAWDASLATAGMGTFGGWVQTTIYANLRTITEKSDVFERALSKINMSGETASFTYDKAGRLTQRSAVSAANAALGVALNQSYYNTGRLAELWTTSGSRELLAYGISHFGGLETLSYRGAAFEYDKVGNVTSQLLREIGVYQGNDYYDNADAVWITPLPVYFTRDISTQTASYDALGRIVSWNEAGSPASNYKEVPFMPAASHAFEYDANGNIRRTLASFRALDAQGAAAATGTAQDYWYRYDALNRMVTSKGQLVSGAIVRGSTGVDTYYNAAGERAYALDLVSGQTRREDYVYDGAGRLSQVKSVTGTFGAVPSAAGVKRADFTYDAMGRLTLQRDFDVNGTTILYSRAVTYNNKGQISFDTSSTLRSGVTFRADSTYSYGAIGADAASSTYALGAALTIDTINYENNVQKKTNKTTNSYSWRDGAQQNYVAFDPDVAVAGANSTAYYYDIIGGQAQMVKADIADGRPRTVTFHNDMMGQGIKRDEKDALSGGDPHEVWYRFSGRQMGYVGNNGTIDSDYAASIANRVAAQGTGAFLNGASTSTSFADFDLAHDHLNSYAQGSAGGMYVVQSGDTLSGIAAALWGDASLWYKIAEVNGLSAESALVEGLPLIVPAGVQRNENNSETFKPYDPLEVLGSTAPTAVAPRPKKKNCGVFGQILLAIVSVVLVKVFGVIPGSILDQHFRVAVGAQEEFSWNAVGMSVLSAVVVGSGKLGVGGSGWGAVAARAMVANAITQGIGVATGMQKEFSWAGVAAAGVGGAFGKIAADKMPGAAHWVEIDGERVFKPAEWYNDLGSSAADMLGNAATRSLVEGTDFGDNVIAALPDVIAHGIWNWASARRSSGEPEAQGDAADKPYMSLDKNVALNAAKSNSSPGHREWWDLWGMAADALFGVDKGPKPTTPNPRTDGVEEDEFVVTAPRRVHLHFENGQVVGAPRVRGGMAAGINETIQGSVTVPLEAGRRHLNQWFHDPQAAARHLDQSVRSAADGMEELARTDWVGQAGSLGDEYRTTWNESGASGVYDLGSYHFGRVLPYVALGGPLGFEGAAGAALQEEFALAMVARGRANQVVGGRALQLGIRPRITLNPANFTAEEIAWINYKYSVAELRIAAGAELSEVGVGVPYSYRLSQRYVRDTLAPGTPIASARIGELAPGMNVDEFVSRQFGGRQSAPNQNLGPARVNQLMGSLEYSATRNLPPGTRINGFEIVWERSRR